MGLPSGKILGHYEILSPLGVGGMGEVYRARDLKLARDVALKVLPEVFASNAERLARFQREARAVAALNHPNIVTIFSVEEFEGLHFMTMELVEGQALDRLIRPGGLPREQIVGICRSLAEALAAAHEKGIIHRDLKPANVMITRDGRVKVLDFGLAKETHHVDASDVTRTAAHTQAGAVMGTPAYMSPEQVAGRPLDHRTDLFSLGIIVYEMATGQRPFQGQSSAELASAVLRDTPSLISEIRADLPSDMARVIRRCMEKDPRRRHQTAREVANELGEVGARPPSDSTATHPEEATPSVAVLPFKNLSADPENEYFSDGLAEEILNALSQVEGLKVAARTSSFSFKGKATEISEIAGKLHVANVLEGSIRRAGNRVRVTVQLVNARNGFHLWSERYDRQMEDIFEVQDEIARAIAERLKVTLASAALRPTVNPEAYELYLKGRHHWHQRSPSSLKLAIECFEQTVKLDPNYALAYSGLADCYGIFRFYGWVSHEAGKPPARAAITRAMSLAPQLWEVNFSQAFYILYFERAWREAEHYFQKALAINPRSSLGHAYYGALLVMDGRVDEARTRTNLALQLDPLSPFIRALSAAVFFLIGDFEQSVRETSQALDLQDGYVFGTWIRGLALKVLGRDEEAVAEMEKTVSLSRAPLFVGLLGLLYAGVGRLEDARRLLAELEDRSGRGEQVETLPSFCIQIGLGNLVEIRAGLGKVIEESTPPVALLVCCGEFLNPFRTDPEINRMLTEYLGP
jgi:serine/threonine protein kinase